MEDSPYIIHSSEVAWSCLYWQVRRDKIGLPNGKEGEYFYVEKPPCVFVVPVTNDNKVILIRNYRHPVKSWCWEVPAGGVEKDQTLEQAAKAELQEEVGGEAKNIEFITKFYFSNGMSNEEAQLFLATGVSIGEHDREEFEIIESHEVSIDDALIMAKNGQIKDAPSALAILLCEELLNSLNKT